MLMKQASLFVSSRSSSVSLPSINGQLGSDNSQSLSSSKRPNSDGRRKTTNSKQKIQQVNILLITPKPHYLFQQIDNTGFWKGCFGFKKKMRHRKKIGHVSKQSLVKQSITCNHLQHSVLIRYANILALTIQVNYLFILLDSAQK